MTIAHLQDLCRALRSAFDTEQLIIAGGAVADTLAGRPVKDIDVFLRLPNEQYEGADASVFRGTARSFVGPLNFSVPSVIGVKFSGGATSGGELADVADLMRRDGPPIQLLALWTDPVDDVAGYDVCQRQCFVTPRALFRTPLCERDFADTTITYNEQPRDPASFERTVDRYLRLQAKYHDWVFVGYEKHEAFLRERSAAIAAFGELA